MLFRNFVVLCAGLLLCENALCEVSELSVAPNVNEQSAVDFYAGQCYERLVLQ